MPKNEELLFALMQEVSSDVKAVAMKVDRVAEKQSDQQRTLDEQAAALKEHIARTKMLEDRIDPIEGSYKNVKFVGKMLTWVIASAGAIAAAAKFLFHFVIR